MIEDMLPPEPELPQPQFPFHNISHTHTFTSADFTTGNHTHSLPSGTAAWKMVGGIPISSEFGKDVSAFSTALDAAMERMKDSITTQLYSKSPLMEMIEKSLQEQESLDSQGDNFGPLGDPEPA